MKIIIISIKIFKTRFKNLVGNNAFNSDSILFPRSKVQNVKKENAHKSNPVNLSGSREIVFEIV